MGLFDDLFDIATAPIKVAGSFVSAGADVVSAVTKPIANAANDVAEISSEIAQDIKDGL